MKLKKILLILINSWFLASCSQVSFENKEVNSQKSTLNLKVNSQNFLITPESQPPIDMIWVIDNSYSMKEEAEQIKLNFAKFINLVSDRSDLRLSLISKKSGSPAAVALPPGLDSQRFSQHDEVIRSRENLTVTTKLLKTKYKDFFRSQAKKVFVLVTDDDARVTLADNFFKSLNDLYPQQSFTVHSFIALDKLTSPCGDRQGQSIKN